MSQLPKNKSGGGRKPRRFRKLQPGVFIPENYGIVFYLSLIITGIAILPVGADDKDWRQDALDAHNKYREKHGVPKLVLDDELNASAQSCADKLATQQNMKHVCGTQGRHIGENVQITDFKPDKKAEAATDATKRWYGEEPEHNYDINDFQGLSQHFSQVVWKSTEKLGIGYAENGEFKIVVANYDPPGNRGGAFKENVLPKSNSNQSGGQLQIGVFIPVICGILTTANLIFGDC